MPAGGVLEQNLAVVGLGHVVEPDDLVAQVRSVGDVDLEVRLLLLDIGGSEFLVGAQTGLLLGLAGLRGHPDPFQLALQRLPALGFLLFLHGEALRLLVQPGGVVALPGNAFAAVQLQDPAPGSSRRRCPGSSGHG